MKTDFAKHYFNPKAPGSFAGIQSFENALKDKKIKFNSKDVKKWLLDQSEYTLHKPIRKKFPRNRIIVYGIDDTFQADLIDLQNISDQNDNFKYLLCVIDVFSKRAWVFPLKNKTGQSIIDSFKIIFQKNIPKRIHTDDGQEFINKACQAYFKKLDINFYTLKSEMKASIVERFNRTIKEKMWRYFTHANDKRYIDVLDDIVSSYNNSYHRSIKMKPSQVNKKNQDKVFLNLYGFDPNKIDDSNYKQIKINFKVGDKVRISKYKNIFAKGYTPNWTEEIFEIDKILYRDQPVYIIKDYDGEIIKGVFYDKELQKVLKTDNSYEIIILDTRKRKGRTEYLVKWKGYPDKFNKWVDQSDLG